MFATYEEAMEWIHTRKGMGPKPGIVRMKWLMEKLGHPERKFRSIHIAGTNGKGSNVAYLRSLFMAAGYTVGTFTSPHIVSFNERISMNGANIPDEDVLEQAKILHALYEEISLTDMGPLTEFEVVTAMMFSYFGSHPCDVVLLEVGLGGLYDSTNVAEPDLSLITTIGKDHSNILGDTLAEIAYQKAGIIKQGTPVVIGRLPEEALSVMRDTAEKQAAPLYAFGPDFSIANWHEGSDYHEVFDFSSSLGNFGNLEIALMGGHQVDNAATALQAFLLFCKKYALAYSETTIKAGLLGTAWPVRMEIVSQKPFIMLDGAHNIPAMEVLAEAIKKKFSEKDITILLAALADKDLEEMGRLIKAIPGGKLHVTSFDFPRAASVKELCERMGASETEAYEDWRFAIDDLKAKQSEKGMLLITGSLYFLSEVRHYLLKDKEF
ncbi:folylpolyglutamate synthase/dihydrofolate synthase family protein [uncultured Trichococcus sp.]|uniref:bifunctional folylpolyglutamate synthase/dihydrofolate synthase n=1 Tax=uncultured Trichococcus sp. TaxID=189665 RepID=UPI002A18DED4|nr:folylpolyglutamate synthase/dihydrofolate synthase family protein [uncultured Trichococcus sp.]